MYHFRHLPRLHAWGAIGRNEQVHDDPVQRVLDRCLGEQATGASADSVSWAPRVDIREEAERFVILVDVPGVDPKDIEIRMDRNVLGIKGERKAGFAQEGAAQEGVRWSRQELARGRFERSFSLPETADADAIQASGRNGVLEIVIPRKPQAKARRIEVN
ncbi:MAG TPA: Hsp20/alpha crystallin family protein [Xanthomonadaceae bacterium]